MADHKPACIHTCTADECTPIVENGPHWFAFHMPCWCCDRDNNRHDLVWHDESAMYFHKLCLLKRERKQTMDAVATPGASIHTLMAFRHACTRLRRHRQAIRGMG